MLLTSLQHGPVVSLTLGLCPRPSAWAGLHFPEPFVECFRLGRTTEISSAPGFEGGREAVAAVLLLLKPRRFWASSACGPRATAGLAAAPSSPGSSFSSAVSWGQVCAWLCDEGRQLLLQDAVSLTSEAADLTRFRWGGWSCGALMFLFMSVALTCLFPSPLTSICLLCRSQVPASERKARALQKLFHQIPQLNSSKSLVDR